MENKVPEFLNKMLLEQYGQELTSQIINGYKQKRKTTFRVNTLKSSLNEIEEVLAKNKIDYKKIKWSEEAFILENASEEDIKKLDIYINGKIYMQSLSSMLPPIILEPNIGEDILDMAAAPGGKTTQMAAITHGKAHITACELNKIRIERLKFNLEKQGASNVYIMPKDARMLDNFFSFDKILLDAPCSGSGTINYFDENLEKRFTLEFLENCAKKQYSLLKKAIEVLKPGKEMVYSTCSILKKENEDIIAKILKDKNTEIVPINVGEFKEISVLPSNIEGVLTVMPNDLYEGFFIAKIKKKHI